MKNSAAKYYGRKITAARLEPDVGDAGQFVIEFENGTVIALSDERQFCCENRYLHTEDDPEVLVGGTLRVIEELSYADTEEDGEYHEIVFLKIGTDKATIILETHNEHNGYYGGLALKIRNLREV